MFKMREKKRQIRWILCWNFSVHPSFFHCETRDYSKKLNKGGEGVFPGGSPFSELNLITRNPGLWSVKSFKLANWVVFAIALCYFLHWVVDFMVVVNVNASCCCYYYCCYYSNKEKRGGFVYHICLAI